MADTCRRPPSVGFAASAPPPPPPPPPPGLPWLWSDFFFRSRWYHHPSPPPLCRARCEQGLIAPTWNCTSVVGRVSGRNPAPGAAAAAAAPPPRLDRRPGEDPRLDRRLGEEPRLGRWPGDTARAAESGDDAAPARRGVKEPCCDGSSPPLDCGAGAGVKERLAGEKGNEAAGKPCG